MITRPLFPAPDEHATARTKGAATALAAAAITGAVIAAYAGALRAPFVFDDAASIAGNATIRHLWTALRPPGGGVTVTGRPFLNLSFALNYALGAATPAGCRAVNFAIHIAAALALFGIVRRTFYRRASAASAGAAAAIGAAVALIWALHPLQTESVTYVVQRAESLMGLCYLLTLYCAIRCMESGRALWSALAALACFAGMATKEVMVSAPLMILLYDRAFAAGTFREALRRRRGLYCALAASWILLAFLVIGSRGRGNTAGFGVGISAASYWAAQGPALVRYLALAVWPHPLVFDYGDTRAAVTSPVLCGSFAVLGLLAVVTLWALVRRPGLGFLGAGFFAILAPTSLVPGARQTLAEHRMYLALIPVVVIFVTGVFALARGLRRRPVAPILLCLLLAGALAVCTAARNRIYSSEAVLWTDTVEKRPDNPFAQDALGAALFRAGRPAEARSHLEAALRLKPDYARANYNLGNVLEAQGASADAVDYYKRALRFQPDLVEAWSNLGGIEYSQNKYSEAIADLRQAVRLDPSRPEPHNNLGVMLANAGLTREAIAEFEEALRLNPRYADARRNLEQLNGR